MAQVLLDANLEQKFSLNVSADKEMVEDGLFAPSMYSMHSSRTAVFLSHVHELILLSYLVL